MNQMNEGSLMNDQASHPVLRAIETESVAVGMFVMEFATRGLPWLARNAGMDFLVYDTEHGNLTKAEVRDGVLGTRAAGLTPIVRVRTATRGEIGPALDAGALGIIVPMVERPEDVADAVEFARYHPIGSRGAAMGLPFHGYDSRSAVDVMAEANASVLVIPQVETVAGMEALDEICAVPEVQLLWVGHGDLAQSMGIPGEFGNPRLTEALESISETATAHGLAVGRLIPSANEASTWIERDYRILSLSADLRLMSQAMAAEVRTVREAGAPTG